MSVLISGPQVRAIELGQLITRAAATIPQTAAQNIFSITGGRVLVTSLVGQVTTVIGGVATTVKFTNTPTSGTATDIASATAITSKEVGTMVSLPLTKGGAVVVGANAGDGVIVGTVQALLLQPGTISYTTSASTTGALSFALTYVVFDTGASVAAL